MDRHEAPLCAMDGLRGAAAQVVLVSHSIAFAFPDSLAGSVSDVRGWLAQLAVATFFVLSGFVITTSLKRRIRNGRLSLFDFAIRRVARIWPPYLFAALLMAGLVVAQRCGVQLQSLDRPIPELPASFLDWLNVFSIVFVGSNSFAPSLNGVIWSLRLELLLYVAAGLAAGSWVANNGRRWLGLIALACLLVYSSKYSFMVLAMGLFGAGGLSAVLRTAWMPPILPGAIGALVIACLPLAFPTLTHIELPISQAAGFLFGVCVASAQPSLTNPLPPKTGLVPRLICSTGDYSYTLYICHWPMLVAQQTIFGANGFATLLGCIVGLNLICYLLATSLERTDDFAALLYRLMQRSKTAPMS